MVRKWRTEERIQEAASKRVRVLVAGDRRRDPDESKAVRGVMNGKQGPTFDGAHGALEGTTNRRSGDGGRLGMRERRSEARRDEVTGCRLSGYGSRTARC